jgi:penicillin-binding protein-related factor A (putative recombinase)
MSLKDQFAGAMQESHKLFAGSQTAVICGRPVPVQIASIERSKRPEMEGFSMVETAPFTTPARNLSGHTVDSLQGTLIAYEKRNYRVNRVVLEGGLFYLYAEAEMQK